MTEAAMSSILNKYAHDFDKEVMEWVHEKRAFAFNQVIEVVVNANPPPFEADCYDSTPIFPLFSLT